MAEGTGPEAQRGARYFSRDSVALLVLLTVLTAYGALSNNMLLPSLPELSRALAVSEGTALLAISVFFVGFATGQLLYGSLSDRYGRRPVLLAGLALYVAAAAACLVAPDIESLMAARLVQGLAAASGQVLARAIIRDLFEPARAAKYLSLTAAVFTFASGLSPLVGGLVLAAIGWRGVFMVLTGVGALTLVVVWRWLGESLAAPDPSAIDPRRIASNYRDLLGSRTFSGYAFGFAALFGAMFAFHSGSSFVFIVLLDLAPEVYGLLFAIVLSGYFVGSVVSARITMHIGLARLVVIGALMSVASAAVMFACVLGGIIGPAIFVAPQFVFMVGMGFLLPNAIAGAMAPFPEKAGAASALIGFAQQGAGGLMVAAVAALADGTAAPMAGSILAGALASFVLVRFVAPHRRAK